ncbi:uncharacterized protein FA14DRAFT_175859 [Meira miltonrushii]|uniref:FHA domain-containing protein n=1 Tax=Meira miltonrushii TaxID=1280837 RepID=A0A316VHN8_9BASI|nr:uncharacterized protein FA14DRAFT_175859 [Meira miltonrushii]PWN36548.1 hypothetical protein FA14DRAFT_175859 [Meira miltonrushii]
MSGAQQQQTNGHYTGNGQSQNTNGSGMTNGVGASQGNGATNGNGVGQLIYPALHLQPLNDTFAPKQISLAPPGPQNKIKIGRQTNNKTIPQPSNGYFDSKVLSRMHAEVWSQDGKVYIKDVKSSNGTFINGARLSAEGQESDTFELHTDDVVEFGIDIVGEDNKSIIHHKVACRVFLVMTAEEALGLRHDFAALYRGGIAGSTLNHHVVGPGAEGGLRRKMGSGGGYGAGGSVNGMMSFDHILHRLQAELQKSRETAGELGSLNAAMSDIGETLGGGLPPMQNPPYQHLVPSANSNDPNAAAKEEEQRRQRTDEANARAAELKTLEDQVKETQQALQAHIDRLAVFESRLDDNEGIKADILSMQEQVRNAQSEAAEAKLLLASKRNALHDDDDDDTASVMSMDTVMPGEGEDDRLPTRSIGKGPVGNDEIDSLDAIGHLDHGDEEEGPSAHDKDLLRRLKEHIGPLAPADGVSEALDRKAATIPPNDDLVRRLEAMESQLEKALELGRNLADQHAEATDNVRKLEERIRSLESEQKPVQEDSKPEVQEPTVKQEDSDLADGALAIGGGAAAAGGVLSILEAKWGKWRDAFEADFAKDRAGLNSDREEIRRVVKMWDTLNQEVEDLVEGAQTDDGGNNDDNKSVSAPTANHSGGSNTGGSKKKKKKKGGNHFQQSSTPSPVNQIRRTTSAVGLGTSADLNRHLRALIYTDDYNLLVRETHMESEGSTSASSSVSDTSRSATSKMTDDTSVGSSGSSGEKASNHGVEGGGNVDLEELPDGVRKRAMVNLASGRRKGLGGEGIEKRWPGFGSKTGGGDSNSNAFDNSASLPVIGAAGVLFVGMTAWIMAGKGGINLAGGMGGGG